MGAPVINDFNLDSEGHCFFCLKRILVKAKQEPELVATQHFQNHSVHYVARYLGMDMGKVFLDKRQIDSSLLVKVRKSRLKVELCEKCTGLNETFSGLYRQLEKLELEIKSNLELIREELLGTDCNPPKFCSSSTRGDEVLQIVDVLREEAIQKCSQKLGVISPWVKLEKLTKRQIYAELAKYQSNSEITQMNPKASFLTDITEFEANVKTEFELPNENVPSDDDNRNYDMDSEAMDEDQANTIEVHWGGGVDSEHNLSTNAEASTNSHVIISAPTTSKNSAEKEKYSIKLGAGRWKCRACSVELTTATGIRRHYQSVHQKIRFRCVPCGKEFANRSHYNRHHQSVHVGIKFQCLGCNKLFSQKTHLRRHQSKTSCKKGPG